MLILNSDWFKPSLFLILSTEKILDSDWLFLVADIIEDSYWFNHSLLLPIPSYWYSIGQWLAQPFTIVVYSFLLVQHWIVIDPTLHHCSVFLLTGTTLDSDWPNPLPLFCIPSYWYTTGQWLAQPFTIVLYSLLLVQHWTVIGPTLTIVPYSLLIHWVTLVLLEL